MTLIPNENRRARNMLSSTGPAPRFLRRGSAVQELDFEGRPTWPEGLVRNQPAVSRTLRNTCPAAIGFTLQLAFHHLTLASRISSPLAKRVVSQDSLKNFGLLLVPPPFGGFKGKSTQPPILGSPWLVLVCGALEAIRNVKDQAAD